MRRYLSKSKRQGAVSVLYVILLIPIMGLIALAVDYGYMLTVRVDLQRTADQAALAAVRDLIPSDSGFQDLAKVRATVKEYSRLNYNDSEFEVRDSDIEIGRYNPVTIYSSPELLNTGVFDTVRVTVRRDELANTSVSLYFARVLGIDTAEISATATAVLQKARYVFPGTHVLPIAIEDRVWDDVETSDEWSVYGDGKIKDEYGHNIPGNWGTIDIGSTSNSTSDLSDQINEGLRQKDLNAMYRQSRIPQREFIDSREPLTLNGDTGFSAGMKHAIQDAHGTIRVVPIYGSTSNKGGGKLDFNVVKWGLVRLQTSGWAGNKNSFIRVKKVYTYNKLLRPNTDLSDTDDIIENAYSSPVLIQ